MQWNNVVLFGHTNVTGKLLEVDNPWKETHSSFPLRNYPVHMLTVFSQQEGPSSTPLQGSRMLVQWTALIQNIGEHGCDPLRDRLVMSPCFCRGKASDPDSVLRLFSLCRHLTPDKLQSNSLYLVLGTSILDQQVPRS